MFNNKKGIALLIVIAVTLMMLILGAAVLIISTGHFGISFKQIQRARAYYAAEAAIQYALWKCREGDYDLVAGDSDTKTIVDPNYSFENVPIDIDPPLYGLNRISVTVTY